MSAPPSTPSSFQAALAKELQHLQLHLCRLHEEGISAVKDEHLVWTSASACEDPVPSPLPSSSDHRLHRRRDLVSLGDPLPTVPEEKLNIRDGSLLQEGKNLELESKDKHSTNQSIGAKSALSSRLNFPASDGSLYPSTLSGLPRAGDFGSSLGVPRSSDFGSSDLKDVIVHPLRRRRSERVIKKKISFELTASSGQSETPSSPRLDKLESEPESRRTTKKASNTELRMHRSIQQLIKDAEDVEINGMLDSNGMHEWMPRRYGRCRMLIKELHGWYRSNETRDILITIVDIVVCFVILVKCILIGVSVDKDTWKVHVFECCVASIFVFEIVLKMMLLGCRETYFGRAWVWSWYDIAICAMSIIELFVAKQTTIIVFRLLRLGRLGRLFRVVVVKELVMIFRGMAAGARCLFWCLLALMLPVYIIGMIVSSPRVLKDWGEEGFFSSVPSAMFTTIRCMCGDCNDMFGRPIVVQLQRDFGWHYAFFYSIFILVSLFGVFNLITAIFLENTMQVAKSDAMLQRRLRENKDKKFARDMKRLVFMFWEAHSQDNSDFTKTNTELARKTNSRSYEQFTITDALDLEITQEFYDKLVDVPGVREVLEDIGILHDDIVDLFQILDVDHSGTLDLTELVDGINKLRGEATKRDLVALAYMIYAMQDSVREIGVELASLSAGGRLPTCSEEEEKNGNTSRCSSYRGSPRPSTAPRPGTGTGTGSTSTSSYSFVTSPFRSTIAS